MFEAFHYETVGEFFIWDLVVELSEGLQEVGHSRGIPGTGLNDAQFLGFDVHPGEAYGTPWRRERGGRRGVESRGRGRGTGTAHRAVVPGRDSFAVAIWFWTGLAFGADALIEVE